MHKKPIRINPASYCVRVLVFILLITTVFSSHAQSDSVQESPSDHPSNNLLWAEAFNLLTSKSFKDKKQAVTLIADIGGDSAGTYLQSLLSAKLYYRKLDKVIFIAEKSGKKFRLTDPLTGDAAGEADRKSVKKITINNSLRSLLRKKIAGLSLGSADASVRYAAIEEMMRGDASKLRETLEPYADTETDARVSQLMETAIALSDLYTDSQQAKLSAIAILSGNLNQAVRNRLVKISQSRDEDKKVIEKARAALSVIDQKIKYYGILETLFFGLSLGSVLVLAAIGLAITFGVMGVINMAHGELIMLGAYTTYLIQQILPGHNEWSILLAIPAAFLVSASAGILIERSVIRFLYGRPLETLLATFGVSLILQQLVRTVISPQNVPVSNPLWMSGSWQINSVLSLTYNRLCIFIFCLLVFVLLYLILKRTSLGLQVRAVSQNRNMARAMGVNSARIDALTFGLGSGIAGIAGVALSQLTNVGPNLGQAYIIDSFMVVVFGGVGNLLGTLVAGLSLGVANKIMEPWAGAVLAKILVLVFIILFIQKRPRGLFPQQGRAAES